MTELADFVQLSPSAADEQWASVLARQARDGRQVPFLPVETLLSFFGSLCVDAHRYGGANAHTAGSPIPEMSKLLQRSPGSILSKMLNLDGSRVNGARWDSALTSELLMNPDRLSLLYDTVMASARRSGISSAALPDFLCLLDLVNRDQTTHALGQSGGSEYRFPPETLSEDSEILAMARRRLGHSSFARKVLRRFDNTCVFCGLRVDPSLAARMLVASHIKPWRDGSTSERLDPANGLAACPGHDAAFDSGLITVLDSGEVVQSELLQEWVERDSAAARQFSTPALRGVLASPEGALVRSTGYLRWHQEHIFRG